MNAVPGDDTQAEPAGDAAEAAPTSPPTDAATPPLAAAATPAPSPSAPHTPPMPKTAWEALWMFSSSGLFFMVVGALFLAIAYSTIGGTHAGLTFVFVVVGIAILLYGTGTQSVGSFDSGAQEARTKIVLAGGAGALAFAVSAGIIFEADRINNAFREETRWLEVYFMAKEDGQSSLSDYIAEFTVDGAAIPVVRRGDKYIVALVPYNTARRESAYVAPLEATFIIRAGPGGSEILSPRVNERYEIKLNERQYGISGLDFDKYNETFSVSLTKAPTAAGLPDEPGNPPAPLVDISPE